MFLAPSLFGDWVLTKEWGRIGFSGTVRVEYYPNAGAALLAMQEIVRLKKARGYCIGQLVSGIMTTETTLGGE